MLREESRGNVAGDGEAAREAGGADTSNCDPASTGVYVNHVILYVKYITRSPSFTQSSLSWSAQLIIHLVFRGRSKSRKCTNKR